MGDIGSSQSLNRYAYCEGNPVSLIDLFGLSPEATQDQGQKSKYEKWHKALDFVGFFWDGADVINAALYAKEKDWKNAAICAAAAIPAIGVAVIGVAKSVKAVIKAKRTAEILSLAAESSRMTKKAADTLDIFSDTMRAAEKYGKSAIKSADNILSDAGAKLAKALETGGDFGKEASKAAKSAEAAGMLRLSTKADDAADALKVTDFYAGPKGVARSLEEYDTVVKNINNKRLYRVMSEGELEAVKKTGKLRGGREGTTYFTDSYFRNAANAKSRLALPEKPTYIMEFEISNSPKIAGGNRVLPNYGELGGGREYYTNDVIEVTIINYQKMVDGR